jgi:hypothetical protein
MIGFNFFEYFFSLICIILCTWCCGWPNALHSLTPTLDWPYKLIGPSGLLLVISHLYSHNFHVYGWGMGHNKPINQTSWMWQILEKYVKSLYLHLVFGPPFTLCFFNFMDNCNVGGRNTWYGGIGVIYLVRKMLSLTIAKVFKMFSWSHLVFES